MATDDLQAAPPAETAQPSPADRLAKSAAFLSPESRATYEHRVLPFLNAHCAKCHDADSATAGFEIDDLDPDFLGGKTATLWREAINKMNLGKMPPAKVKERPDPHEAFAVTEWVNQEMRRAIARRASLGGRVPIRRMNRAEYANTIRDLFYLGDHFAREIERELPTDGKVDGFDRGSAALLVEKSQLEAYLDAARKAVAEALPIERPAVRKFRFEALKDSRLTDVKPPKIKISEILGVIFSRLAKFP
jgi:mono/diheme cytochrome c family protein